MGRYGDEIRQLAAPMNNADDLDPLLERIDGSRIVMLGEASHGTHEFYQWRATLTRRLIEERGFSFVGVEGDWPDCDRVDRSVRCRGDAPDDPRQALEAFDRWPTWMWANDEVVDFCCWLRDRNVNLEPAARAGFHGLDVYSLWESMRELILHLNEHDPDKVGMAVNAYRCFEPFGEDPQRYAMATRFVPMSCEEDVVKLLRAVREHSFGAGGEEFAVWQNAEVVAGAERYYRAMVAGGANSWNVRDQHMMDTLDRLLTHYGPDSKAVVWAHNTHVGDARATDMTRAGMFNIGQLGRERYGRDNVVLVGFGTHRGTVMAGHEWGAPMEVMRVPTARPGSIEEALHADAPPQAQLVFPPAGRGPRPRLLTDWLDHRAIGVVYHPDREHWGNYVPTKLGDRYDAFCWFDQTRAVHPLHVYRVDADEPETYPVGV